MYPSTRICSGCLNVFNRAECDIDIGDFWNLPKELAWACSKKCAEDAKDNWLKPIDKFLSTIKFVKEKQFSRIETV